MQAKKGGKHTEDVAVAHLGFVLTIAREMRNASLLPNGAIA